MFTLPQIDEQDKLPKILCTTCLAQVEAIAKFRETCINAQTMLESCLNSSKLGQGGKVNVRYLLPALPTTTQIIDKYNQNLIIDFATGLYQRCQSETGIFDVYRRRQ